MSVAKARANGAVTIVNAIATRKGAAVAVDLETVATVELLEGTTDVLVEIRPDKDEDPTLVQEVVREVLARLDEPTLGARVVTESTIPVSRGMKSSSAAANAVALATSAAHQRFDGRGLPRKDALDAAITAALRAGVTVTGAFDDASASFSGGVCVTDNSERKLLHRYDIQDEEDLVAVVHVPARKVRTLATKDLPYASIAPVALRAHALALRGEWADAMTLNGLAFGALYGVPPRPALDALARGARAASVSGTGPAVAAIAPRALAADVADALAGAGPGDVLTLDLVTRKAEVFG